MVVIAALGAGGAERVIALLTTEWVNCGHDVTLVAFDAPGDPDYHGIDPRIRVCRLGPFSGKGAAAVLAKTRLLRGVLRRHRPDVAVGFLTKINAMLLVASLGLKARVVVAERNNPQRQQAHRGWTWSLRWLYRRADAIVLQTVASRACLPAAVTVRAHVIPNPIEPTRAMPQGLLPQVIIGVGRLQHQKGFDLLIEAFATIAPRHPQWKLVIWGEGPDRGLLTKQISGLGMVEQILLPGLSKTPRGWVASGAIYVLSSRYEGYPNALGEAMAAGLAVVAFNCPYGPSEMVTPGVDGLLVSDGDVDAMVNSLEGLINNADWRQSLGTAARKATARLDPKQVALRWTDRFADH